MKFNKKLMILFSIVCFVLCSFPPLSLAGKTFKVGVLAKRGKSKTVEKWSAHMKYLSTKTGHNFILVPLAFDEIFSSVSLRKIDFILTNPGFFVVLQKKFGVRAIASLVNYRQGKPLNRFGGVIFTKKDSISEKSQDLRNASFMCVKMTSFGGAQMAFKHFLDRGINPFKDFSKLLEGGTHDAVVYAVRDGIVNAGTVRSDTLERMAAEGKISLNDFKIIDQVNDSFPFIHSTVLYPEWPFATLKYTNPEVVQAVTQALMAMKPSDQAARKAKIAGWSAPLNYKSVAECLKVVKDAP